MARVVRFAFSTGPDVVVPVEDAAFLADELRSSGDELSDSVAAAVFIERSLEDVPEGPAVPFNARESAAMLSVLNHGLARVSDALRTLRHAIADEQDRTS